VGYVQYHHLIFYKTVRLLYFNTLLIYLILFSMNFIFLFKELVQSRPYNSVLIISYFNVCLLYVLICHSSDMDVDRLCDAKLLKQEIKSYPRKYCFYSMTFDLELSILTIICFKLCVIFRKYLNLGSFILFDRKSWSIIMFIHHRFYLYLKKQDVFSRSSYYLIDGIKYDRYSSR
jgi:hypothetical protein